MTDEAALDAALMAAHRAGDLAALVRLYQSAGEAAEAAGDRDRAAFFLTHAWVFALEAGLPEAGAMQDRLRGWGRC